MTCQPQALTKHKTYTIVNDYKKNTKTYDVEHV